MKITVAIPVHQMESWELFLGRSLLALSKQTYKDFDVLISDNSEDNKIEKFVSTYGGDIDYVKCETLGMASNTNSAIRNADGEFIKLLYMDDYLAHENALAEIVLHVDNSDWLVTGCEHDNGDGIGFKPHFPKYNNNIHLGKNTIGSPSVLTIRNDSPLLFDEYMTWLLDCDYYKRMYDEFGEPRILNTVNVVIGVGDHQVTHLLSDYVKQDELNYMISKYA